MKIINAFKKLEFSKKLAVIVSILYVLSIIFSFIMLSAFAKDMTVILDYVQYSFVIVLCVYLCKTVPENVMKIKVSNMFKPISDDSTSSNSTESSVG